MPPLIFNRSARALDWGRVRTMIRPALSSSGFPPSVPAGERVYVLGDIHGRLDLLRRVHDRLRAEALAAPHLRHTVLYVGDYVDRGQDSRGVLDHLLNCPLPGFHSVHLMGNHEDMLLAFLAGAPLGANWISMGGNATLASYGLPVRPDLGPEAADLVREKFKAALPSPHLAFLRALGTHLVLGDYLFVHAGLRPGVPLHAQSRDDMLWIREPFLNSAARFEKVVVHGHTTVTAPWIGDNRIGIDTGAYATGRLTCLVLEGASRRFLDSRDDCQRLAV